MKKRIITVIIAVLILGNMQCYAQNANIEMQLEGASKIKTTQNTYILTITLGDITQVTNNYVLGYETILEYDENIFKNVTVKGLNGWTCSYKDSTKILIGDTSAAKKNTPITQIIFTLKEAVEPTTTDITLKNILLTDDQNDFEYDKKITITIQEEDKTVNEQQANTQSNKTTTQTQAQNTDISTATKQLPKTGIELIILIGIVLFGSIIFISGKNYVGYLKDTNKQMKK